MIIFSHRLIAPIGRGSFAEVWLAQQCLVESRASELHALKISYNKPLEQEFEREAYQLRHFAGNIHPRLLPIYGIAKEKDRFVVVLHLADGNLFDYVKSIRHSHKVVAPDELLPFFRDAASALDCLHARQFIHGGVNPEDILVSNRHAFLADPGPRLMDVRDDLTMPTANLCKSLCMAPERRHREATVHSDQYSLAASYAWLRLGHPISNFSSLEEELSSLPDRERQVLLKGLSANPENRYLSCMVLCEALAIAIGEQTEKGKEKGTS